MNRGGRQKAPRVSATVPGRGPAPFDAGAGSGHTFVGGRDSDASLCSSRPSSAGGRPLPAALLTDRSSQSSALRSINAYLSSHSVPFSLKPPLPSARDITETLRFLLSRLDFPYDPHHLDDDLPSLLRHLGCPIKINKSALKAPGTPHSWPSLLSVLHWLVQLALYSDHLSSSPPPLHDNQFLLYITRCYSLFISADDDAIAAIDDEYLQNYEHQVAKSAAAVDALYKEASDLESKLHALSSGPSRREVLEGKRAPMLEDVKKFQAVVDSCGGMVAAMEAALGEWEKELEAKERESRRICSENEELQRIIDAQSVNASDAERMRRELQAVERDVAEAETGRNALEEKAWELEAEVGRKFKELETPTEQCNQAIRK